MQGKWFAWRRTIYRREGLPGTERHHAGELVSVLLLATIFEVSFRTLASMLCRREFPVVRDAFSMRVRRLRGPASARRPRAQAEVAGRMHGQR